MARKEQPHAPFKRFKGSTNLGSRLSWCFPQAKRWGEHERNDRSYCRHWADRLWR